MRERDEERLYREANCRDADPEMFFADGNRGIRKETRRAIEHVCGACAVRDLCEEAAEELPVTRAWGRWGGSTRSLRPSSSLR